MLVPECLVVTDPPASALECISPLPVHVPLRAKLGTALKNGFSALTYQPVFAYNRKQRQFQDYYDDSFGIHYISHSAQRAIQLGNFDSI